MPRLSPTNKCFDDSLDLLAELVSLFPDLREHLRLVHGVCIAWDLGAYSHAWVEDLQKDIVVFVALQDGERQTFMAPRSEYHDEMMVLEFTSYTWQEATWQNARHNNYGPWEERYLRLCRERKG